MAQPSLDDEEPPLDPALERVQARLRRLMLIAGLTLGVGIFAVFAAILYRIVTMNATGEGVRPAEAGATTPAEMRFGAAELGLPADARLVSTAVDGGRVALTFAHSGGHTVVVIDQAGKTVLSRVELPGL